MTGASDDPEPLTVGQAQIAESGPHSQRSLTAAQQVWRWLAVLGALYLLISAVNVMSRGFRLMGDDAAHQLFAFASNPIVGLAVGILATVLIQSSSTTTAITVTAVGTGALYLHEAVPIIMGSNVGTTVTCTLVALGFVGNREEFRRALAASTIHDFFNLLALLIFFPIELIFRPLERVSNWMTELTYGNSALPNPSQSNVVRLLTRPVVNAVSDIIGGIGSQFVGAVLVLLTGVAMIFLAVRVLSTLLKSLLIGRTRTALTRAVDRGPGWAMATGFAATVVTQSSTVTNSVLVPFVGAGAISPRQLYPVTLGTNIGTTLTALLAAFAVSGGQARVGLQAAYIHLIYNIAAVVVIFGIPILRPIPLRLAELFADRAVDNKRLVFAYLIGVFILLPVAVIAVAALT
jgi:sodium-dependent phosphate cotransporter